MDASTIKIGQKFSKSRSTPAVTTHLVKIKDSAGNTIHTGISLQALRRFFGLAESTFPARPSTQKGEKLELIIPTIGETTPKVQAVAHLLRYAVCHHSAPSGSELASVSRESDRHTPNQLLHLVAAANAVALRPAYIRSKLEDQALDSMTALARKGELTSDLLELAASLFPAEHYFLRCITRNLAEAVHLEQVDRTHVVIVLDEVRHTLPKARGNFLGNLKRFKRESAKEEWN